MHERSGQYTISSAYDSIRHREEVVNWNNSVWLSKGIPRQQFLLWLTVRDSLKTREMLIHTGMEVEDNCVLCNRVPKTIQHLFFECGFVLWSVEASVGKSGLSTT